MVSHTADNTDTFTTTTGQPNEETAVPLTFRGIVIPKPKIFEGIRESPLQSCRRKGSRIIVGNSSPSEQSVFKDAICIEKPNEFDISHSGY